MLREIETDGTCQVLLSCAPVVTDVWHTLTRISDSLGFVSQSQTKKPVLKINLLNLPEDISGFCFAQ